MKVSEMEVTLIDYMGDDNRVVDAARVSFHKLSSQYTDEQNHKLIHYLAKHKHFTPFAHAFASFRIKAPIFVARQLVKHQVGLAWNEVSRRYVDDPPEMWLPSEWRGRPVNAKQGSDGVVNTVMVCIDNKTEEPRPVNDLVEKMCDEMDLLYKHLIDSGIAPEQARMVLPQNTMTEWIWSGSLAAFARVCKLRLDPHAQLETQIVAQRIAEEMSRLFPVSFKSMMEN